MVNMIAAVLFYMGIVSTYVLVIIMPITEKTRGRAMSAWFAHGIAAIAFILLATEYMGYVEPAWKGTLGSTLWSWAALLIGLIIALSKQRKSRMLIPSTT